jgi:hypothetical protein
MSKHFLAGAIVLLSLSIGYLAFQVGNGFATTKNNDQALESIKVEKGLMTMEEAAEYLSLSEKQLEELIRQHDLQRSQLTSFDTYSFIPYIKIKNNRYFNKQNIDEWIKHSPWQVIE